MLMTCQVACAKHEWMKAPPFTGSSVAPPALRGFSSGGGGVGLHLPTLFQFDDG